MDQKTAVKLLCLALSFLAVILFAIFGMDTGQGEPMGFVQPTESVPAVDTSIVASGSESASPDGNRKGTSANKGKQQSRSGTGSYISESQGNAPGDSSRSQFESSSSSLSRPGQSGSSGGVGNSNSSKTNSSSQVAFPPFESEQSVPESSGDAAKNKQQAKEITETYSVSILLAKEKGDFPSGKISSYAAPDDAIGNNLQAVAMSLRSFPTAYFRESGAPVIHLVMVYMTFSGDIEREGNALILPCQFRIDAKRLTHKLLEMTAPVILNRISPDFSDYLPKGFYYGFPKAMYIYSGSGSFNGYFINLAAQNSAYDDIYETFMGLFEQRTVTKNIPSSIPFYKKVRYLSGLLSNLLPCIRNDPFFEPYL